ncbi:unnamed protein product [Citrullus colocynthis]|uniref:Uncharacterized protein n=1 Tax=Citrullus colocynthis TaxID=252529 RepID=A0ABP0XL32_9ROSI
MATTTCYAVIGRMRERATEMHDDMICTSKTRAKLTPGPAPVATPVPDLPQPPIAVVRSGSYYGRIATAGVGALEDNPDDPNVMATWIHKAKSKDTRLVKIERYKAGAYYRRIATAGVGALEGNPDDPNVMVTC